MCGDDRVTDCDRSEDPNLVTVDGTQAFTDLARALGAASVGSEVLVCPGTYVGPFEAPVPVRLLSSEGSAKTFLDGDSGGTTLSVPGGSEIVGFEVRNGDVPDGEGGGIRMTAAGTLRVSNATSPRRPAVAWGSVSEGASSSTLLRRPGSTSRARTAEAS